MILLLCFILNEIEANRRVVFGMVFKIYINLAFNFSQLLYRYLTTT